MAEINPKLLEDIGLTEGETKVYLSLLRMGESKTGPIAKDAMVSSSKVYKILDRLINKGLVVYVIKGKVKFFSAVEPRRILDYMKRREKEFKKKMNVVADIIPQLENEMNIRQQPEAVVYDGLRAVSNFFWNILDELKSGEQYYVLGANYGDQDPVLRAFFSKYHKARYKRGIKVKMLANHNERRNLLATTKKSANIRYLPEHFISKMQITFYKNKAFISIMKKRPTGFLIYGEEAVRNFQGYFDSFWRIAKK
jgi:sugar-specific transcriptional regulator TrmB